MSVQYVAEASQKLTVPEVTAAAPAVTVAVKVTALLEATLVTALPPEVTASVMVVGPDCDQPRIILPLAVIKSVARISTRQLILARKMNLNILNAIGTELRLLIPSVISVSAI
jgi:hypothetical protein